MAPRALSAVALYGLVQTARPPGRRLGVGRGVCPFLDGLWPI